MTTAKKLPDVFVRSLQRAIAEAEHPVGMSPHDGKARVDASHLRRVLGQIATLEAQRDAAIKRAEADAKDAARYRWLRECSPVRSDRVVTIQQNRYIDGKYQDTVYLDRDDLDRYIDAALAQQPSGDKEGWQDRPQRLERTGRLTTWK